MTRNRKQYRTIPTVGTALEVALLGAGNNLHHATVLDIAGGGLRLMLASNHPESTRLGTVYQLRLQSSTLPAPIDTPAMIVHAEREGSDLLLGMRFLDWMGLRALAPAAIASLFNMRQEPRLALDPSSPVAVIVNRVHDPLELHGVVIDVSRSGMCFSASLQSQRTLGDCDRCRVEFKPPGLDRCFRFGANIRNRSLQGESLRYGVWFERDLTEGFGLMQEELGQYVEARLASAVRNLAAK